MLTGKQIRILWANCFVNSAETLSAPSKNGDLVGLIIICLRWIITLCSSYVLKFIALFLLFLSLWLHFSLWTSMCYTMDIICDNFDCIVKGQTSLVIYPQQHVEVNCQQMQIKGKILKKCELELVNDFWKTLNLPATWQVLCARFVQTNARQWVLWKGTSIFFMKVYTSFNSILFSRIIYINLHMIDAISVTWENTASAPITRCTAALIAPMRPRTWHIFVDICACTQEWSHSSVPTVATLPTIR